jgi:peptidoglycan/xylan/chitin deacetylase (PgdA/CDA1 family)
LKIKIAIFTSIFLYGFCFAGGDPVVINRIKGCKEKKVLLTFDDGPSSKVTPQILKILEKHGIKAIFFVLGQRITKETDILLRNMVQKGHLLANHSFDHKSMKKICKDQQLEILTTTNQAISPYQKEIIWFRPPYGSYNTETIACIKKLGMMIMMWSIDTFDWKRPSFKTLWNRIQPNLKPGSIILFHDIHKSTAQNLEKVICAIKTEGFDFINPQEAASLVYLPTETPPVKKDENP